MAIDPATELTLGILAGGAGRRCGGQDKGWIEIDGTPQVVGLLDRYAAQVAAVIISANRNVERYRALGVEVVADRWPDYPGPFAGLLMLLEATTTRFLLTLPVDLERPPDELIARIAAACDGEHVLVCEDDDGVQPLIACYPRTVLSAARAAFARGERAVRRWQGELEPRPLRLAGITVGNRNQLRDRP